MSFCDQCRTEGGLKIGAAGFKSVSRIVHPPKYKVSVAGAKMLLCPGHLKRLQNEMSRRRKKRITLSTPDVLYEEIAGLDPEEDE